MKVKHGWTGEVAAGRWAKLDVVLEEEDLRRLVAAKYPDTCDEVLRTIPVRKAFRVLELQAELMLLLKLNEKYGYSEGIDVATKLNARVHEILDSIRPSV